AGILEFVAYRQERDDVGSNSCTRRPPGDAPEGTKWGCAGLSRRLRLFVVSRARTTNGKRPVLQRQPFHAAELSGVVRDEPEPQTARVSGNEEIVGSDHLAPFLQVSTYLGIMGSSSTFSMNVSDATGPVLR